MDSFYWTLGFQLDQYSNNNSTFDLKHYQIQARFPIMNSCSERDRYRDRPYIIINCAMSIDGKIALPTKKPVKLSSLEDFRRVHELRNYCDAILVGINTILFDDPKLTVKPEFVIKPKNPVRIVLDTNGQVPKNANVLNGDSPTYIIIGEKPQNSGLCFPNSEAVQCPVVPDRDEIDLKKLMKILYDKGIENLLVEGGESVIFSFLRDRLFDELTVFISNKIIGGTESPTMAGGPGFLTEDDMLELRLYSVERMGDGILLKYLA